MRTSSLFSSRMCFLPSSFYRLLSKLAAFYRFDVICQDLEHYRELTKKRSAFPK